MVVGAEGYAFGGFVHYETKLGGDDGFVTFPFQGACQNPFAVTGAIVRGSVEEVDAEVERGVNGAHRFVIVNVAPAARPIQPVPEAADRPAAQSHGADLNIRAPQHSLRYLCNR